MDVKHIHGDLNGAGNYTIGSELANFPVAEGIHGEFLRIHISSHASKHSLHFVLSASTHVL